MGNPNVLDKMLFAHPRAAGESYLRHLAFTLKYGFYLFVLSLCLVIHGFIPGIFTHMVSDKIQALNERFQARRARTTQQENH